MKIEIRKNGLGEFQVWKGNEVLRPRALVWESDYQSKHNFMFFDSLDEAEKAMEQILLKENQEIVRTYNIKEK